MLGDSLAQVAKDTTIIKEVIVNVADTVTNYVYIKEIPMTEGLGTMEVIGIIGIIFTFAAIFVALFWRKIKP